MNFSYFNSLKVKIVFIFSLLMAAAFWINWQIAVKTIHDEKVEDLEKVFNHLLVESRNDYIHKPLNAKSSLEFLHTIPHNLLILKDSEASNVRFTVSHTPYDPSENEVSSSILLENGFYLSAISDHAKIDASEAKYGTLLSVRYLESFLIIFAVSFVIIQRYMRPLEVLAERSRRWKSGDTFEFSVHNAGQEIEELSQSFSALVNRIEGFRAKEKALFKEMAHELKTPIALMRARLDVYEGSDCFSKDKMMYELGSDIERLMSELKNVLFFESSDFEDPVVFEISDILMEIINKVEILAERRSLKITLSPESFTVYAPRKMFLKVVRALMENALTYAKEDSEIIIDIDAVKKSLTIINQKGKEKYLFSSKIGQKMLDRVSLELGIRYEILDDGNLYQVNLFLC